MKFDFFTGDLKQVLADTYGGPTELAKVFENLEGPPSLKWVHFFPIYERYLARWRGRPVRFLEIGVSLGGSLQMWRKYFGPEAVIYGIDISETCRQFDGLYGQVRIGSQADPDFLAQVIEEMGGVDLVLDDGSHMMDHMRASLNALWPHVPEGGAYILEDLHCNYWSGWQGGLDAEGNFFNDVRRMIDDMHGQYHSGAPRHPVTAGQISGIHVYDSIVVLEKNTFPPAMLVRSNEVMKST